VTELELSGVRLRAEHVRRIVRSPDLRGLTRLNLLGALRRVHAKGRAEALGFLGSLTQLRSLNLSYNFEEPEDVAVLRRLSIVGLKTLRLVSCNLTDRVVQDLERCEAAPSLTTLDLFGNEITPDGVRQIAASERLRALLRLTLGSFSLMTVWASQRDRPGDEFRAVGA
jgi:hypothetical protein